MNKIMKKNFLIAIITVLSCLAVTNVSAQAADHSFNYQGELIDNGTPANGEYDIVVQMVDGQGADVGSISGHENTQVTNGLFNIDVEIGGLDAFDGFEDYFFEISIRPGDSGGSFTVLSPVQALQAVPLATNLVNGDAVNGEVLTFNGFQWTPLLPTAASTPWTESGSNVSYDGTVGIGGTTIANVDLFIDSDTGRSPFIARVNNDPKFQINANGGTTIGFLLQTPPADGLLVEKEVRIGENSSVSVASSNGLLSVGSSSADHITFDGDDIQARNGSTNNPDILFLNWYGGDVFIASSGNETIVRGDVEIRGDVKQPITSDGMMKYMVHVSCGNTGSTIIKSYNGVGTGSITITNSPVQPGRCVITFPDTISSRYYQVSPLFGVPGRVASCRFSGTNDLQCVRYNPSTLSGVNGEIMILVY